MTERSEKSMRGSVNSIFSGSGKYLIHGFSLRPLLGINVERIGN